MTEKIVDWDVKHQHKQKIKVVLILLARGSQSADNLCKQFESRSERTECRSLFGSKSFDTLIVYLKEFFEKVNTEKSQQTTKKS